MNGAAIYGLAYAVEVGLLAKKHPDLVKLAAPFVAKAPTLATSMRPTVKVPRAPTPGSATPAIKPVDPLKVAKAKTSNNPAHEIKTIPAPDRMPAVRG